MQTNSDLGIDFSYPRAFATMAKSYTSQSYMNYSITEAAILLIHGQICKLSYFYIHEY